MSILQRVLTILRTEIIINEPNTLLPMFNISILHWKLGLGKSLVNQHLHNLTV